MLLLVLKEKQVGIDFFTCINFLIIDNIFDAYFYQYRFFTVDFSRSGTPDFEKHFKSLENAQSNNPSIVSQCQNLDTRYNKSEFKEIYSTIPEKPSCNKSEEFPLMKGILKSYDKDSKVNLNKPTSIIHKTVKSTTIIDDKESTISTEALKFTDKLFMKAEPKRNEQLKVFTEEGNIKANFTSNNVEEIKSEDIRNMRQNSMKARLQSMFDAISGKSKYNIILHMYKI